MAPQHWQTPEGLLHVNRLFSASRRLWHDGELNPGETKVTVHRCSRDRKDGKLKIEEIELAVDLKRLKSLNSPRSFF